MVPEEAKWIGERLAACPSESLFPFLNVGSSTGTFRSITQPFIDAEIFGPLSRRGGPIIHLDMKAALGVDLVGDILDADFVEQVRRTTEPRFVLLSNVLEHVLDPRKVADAVSSLVGPNGLILVSGPHRYPHHPDPIDNGFRPSVEEVHALFSGTRALDSGVIVSRTWRPWSHLNAGRLNAFLFLARLALPMYRPSAWRRRMDAFPYLFRRVSAYAVLLQRDGTGNAPGYGSRLTAEQES